MNALTYCEFGNLIIRKPNGLEYRFDNVDKPDLGFDFDVLIYDQIEVKVLKWEEGKPLDQQETLPLSETERDSIEQYIENSEPPHGVNLNNQYIGEINRTARDNIFLHAQKHGFDDFFEAVYAGREGSAHPYRSDARRVLEYADAVNNVLDGLFREISVTREDTLKPIEDYLMAIPTPSFLKDGGFNAERNL